jgi:hypothetical protein
MLEEWRECRGVRGEEGILKGRDLSKLDAWADMVLFGFESCRWWCSLVAVGFECGPGSLEAAFPRRWDGGY